MAKLMTRLGELWKFHNVHIYISIPAHINSQTRKSLTISWKTKVQETQSCMSFACDRIQFCFKERHFSNAHDWQPQWAGLDCLLLLTNMLELCSRRKKLYLHFSDINRSWERWRLTVTSTVVTAPTEQSRLPGSGPETLSPVVWNFHRTYIRCENPAIEVWAGRPGKVRNSVI